MSRQVIKGQNLRLKLDGKYIAAATNATINLNVDTEEISTKDDGTVSGLLWKKQEAVSASWDFSAEALYIIDAAETGITPEDIIDMIGTEVSVEFENASGSENRTRVALIRTGRAVITSASISAANKSNATVSINGQGVGELTKTAPESI